MTTFEDHTERPMPTAPAHAVDCSPGGACVECGGCDCGLIPGTCTGPGCYSHDAHDEWWDEQGHDYDGCSYSCH